MDLDGQVPGRVVAESPGDISVAGVTAGSQVQSPDLVPPPTIPMNQPKRELHEGLGGERQDVVDV